MVRRKMYWDRSKSFSASESLLWALILDLHHRQPRSHFSWRVTWQGDFCHLEEAANLVLSWYWKRQPTFGTELILVDTSWHWVDTELLCSGAQQVVGDGIWHWYSMYNCYNCQRQSHIISSKNTTACTVGPFYWAIEFKAEQPPHYAWTQQRIYTALPAHDITVQGSTVHLKRLRFLWKWVLNRIDIIWFQIIPRILWYHIYYQCWAWAVEKLLHLAQIWHQ